MKGLALMLAAAMLTFTLTACGCSADTAGNDGSAGTQTEGSVNSGAGSDAVGPNGTANENDATAGSGASNGATNGSLNGSSSDHSVGSDIGSAMDDVADGIGNAVDDMTGSDHSAGEVTYGQMLNRGRIDR